jgi:hypothetical protein
MTQTTGRILKGNQVNIEGKCRLGLSQANHNSAQNMNTMVNSPQARIIENNEEYVVIQVPCSCGKQITIRGKYVGSQSS